MEIGTDIGIDVQLKRDDSAELDFGFNADVGLGADVGFNLSGNKRLAVGPLDSRPLDDLEFHDLNHVYVNKPVNARSPDDSVLSQLQAFVDNTLHLLHAVRRSDGKCIRPFVYPKTR